MYKWTDTNKVVRQLSDGASIPTDPANTDWKRVQEWVAQGNTIEAQDPPPPPSQDELDAVAAKAYAKLTALKAMTPAQVDTWVEANVTNLAQAKDAIKTLAIGVSILARRM